MATAAKSSRAAKPKSKLRAATPRKRVTKRTSRLQGAALAEDIAAREKIAATLDVDAFMKDYEQNKETSLQMSPLSFLASGCRKCLTMYKASPAVAESR